MARIGRKDMSRFSTAAGAALLAIFLIVGCGAGSKDTTDQGEKKAAPAKKRIALVMKTLTNPFFVAMEKGARKAEQELNIELIVKTGAKETSIEQQIAIIDELIRNRVDAIVIAPASSTEIIPILKKAQEAKIVIVNIDNQIDPEPAAKMGLADVPFISVDNEKGAYIAAKYISDQVKKPTKAAILEGIRSAKNAEQRKAGAVRAFRENRHIRLVASESANWKIDEAFAVTARMFQKHPDIGMIFCANDMMALGTIHYLQQHKKTGVLVAAFDALEEARAAIRQGTLQITIDQQADRQGYLGVHTAMEMLGGKKPAPVTMVDVLPVHL